MPRRKTDEEFKKEIYDMVGNEYTFLDSYVTNKIKLRVKHNECGNIYEVQPTNFLTGSRCPYCSINAKKTDTEFKQEVFDLVGGEYVFLDSYVNNCTKIRVKHNKCGYIYKATPNSFLSGKRCPYCFGTSKKTDTQFKQEVKSLVGNEYIFLDPYVNTRTKLKVKHNKCNNVYEVKPNSFLTGYRCPYCSSKATKTNTQFKKEVFDLVGNEYTFLDTYVNDGTKIKVRHNKCGKVYMVNPSNFIQGNRCPYCNIKAKTKTNIEFQQEVHDLVGNEYTFLEPYQGANTKIKVKHNICGQTYEVQPRAFLNGNRCPYCSSPKGELIISKILNNLNINYEYQKTFDDLKDNRLLSYDFFISSQNILIEYQGKQHYEPVDYFGGTDRFKLQQKHDKMKANYAKDNDYSLITVPYTEDNFSKIKKYLLQHGLSK